VPSKSSTKLLGLLSTYICNKLSIGEQPDFKYIGHMLATKKKSTIHMNSDKV
jgi:hypothetical protein